MFSSLQFSVDGSRMDVMKDILATRRFLFSGGGILPKIVVWNEVRRCFITRLAFCLEWLSLGMVLEHISGSWKDELRLPL